MSIHTLGRTRRYRLNDWGTGPPFPFPGTPRGWWHLDFISQTDYTELATWPDYSGNGYNFTKASATGPLFISNIQNGKSVLAGSTNKYYYENASFATGMTEGEIFIALQSHGDPGTDAYNGLWRFGGAADSCHYPFVDGNIYDGWLATVRKSCGNATQALNSFHIYNVVSKSGEWTSRINDVQHYTTATNTVSDSGAARLFASNNTYYAMSGYIAEVIVFATAFTDSSQRTAVYTYLKNKFGL